MICDYLPVWVFNKSVKKYEQSYIMEYQSVKS